ncbi:hypothetical protein A3G63_02810 [Candidatus Kaiserbacteria bacterium RIFCSPLOWO2_12_FULL_52_8]|uniref:Uncharacterized protein n=1 Tax=Candidatus Kaiserbacteria bacterium RIFCSPHIGHO2_01_FULL_53_31 TaxID=1798481 RepID=A0A1F6CHL1_9BACT|nr:MAG: hypothetical protein A2678_02000 [Candidatus Kaiserbacteria bacterium RIFCSPHIGHO2_01_FULL_53_31]OGG92853.1 MAG: hypothetical protein A3G63_02810 [Candidatus Kaiserbacteria bacterium RIFCSPLOWO2_12_FULL_52_8]
MTTFNRFSASLLVAGIAASSVFALALPSFAHAATYAYVTQNMEVSTVTANDWMSAIATAFNIDEHSGVLLLTSQYNNIVGKHI